MRVLVEEDKSSPVVGIVNVVGAGSTDDPPGKEGLAHLVEHLDLPREPTPTANMWGLLAQAGGANVNASTDFDATVYHVQGPRDALADPAHAGGLRIVDPSPESTRPSSPPSARWCETSCGSAARRR